MSRTIPVAFRCLPLFARFPVPLPLAMKLWMFQQPERAYQPAVATEGWGGPGAYVTERQAKSTSGYPMLALL